MSDYAKDEAPQAEQSMDDILASIRRIMLDEQARLKDDSAPEGAAAPAVPASFVLPVVVSPETKGTDKVLVLDDSMAVPVAATSELGLAPAVPANEEAVGGAEPSPPAAVTGLTAQTIEEMLAPAAAAAAAASVDALLRKLAEDRTALLQPVSASPTLEEFVRAALKPLLKSWLDENLPTMVERLVRAELARLTLRHGA